MSKIQRIPAFHRLLHRAAVGLVCASLAACAAHPPSPQPALLAAEQAIQAAEQARVLDAASPELTLARSQYQAAQKAQNDEKPIEAKRLAEEARLQAELATARAAAAKAKTVNEDLQKGNSTLQNELQRKTGIQP